jgi:hypothetical protein
MSNPRNGDSGGHVIDIPSVDGTNQREQNKQPERCIVKLVGSFPVIFVLGLVGWSYYVYVFVLFGPQLFSDTSSLDHFLLAIISLSIFHVLLALFLASYFKCILTNPGEIPSSFDYEVILHNSIKYLILKLDFNSMRLMYVKSVHLMGNLENVKNAKSTNQTEAIIAVSASESSSLSF